MAGIWSLCITDMHELLCRGGHDNDNEPMLVFRMFTFFICIIFLYDKKKNDNVSLQNGFKYVFLRYEIKI